MVPAIYEGCLPSDRKDKGLLIVDSLVMSSAALVSSVAGVGVGFWIQGRLPGSHLAGESRDVVKQVLGLIATMVALVIGLLVASAKTAFDAQEAGFEKLSTNVIVLDKALIGYGPEAVPARAMLKGTLASTIDLLWPSESSRPAASLDDRAITEDAARFYSAIRDLTPKTDAQREIRTQAIQTAAELSRTRWSLGLPSTPLLPTPFLVVLISWLTVLFAGFGLLGAGTGR